MTPALLERARGQKAFKEAIADAIETHRRMGRSIVVSYCDGVRVFIPAKSRRALCLTTRVKRN